MPPLTLRSAIILWLIYIIPLTGFLATYTFKPALICVDVRFAVLSSSLLGGFINTALHFMSDLLYIIAYGQDGTRERSENFQRWKSAALYLVSAGFAIALAGIPLLWCHWWTHGYVGGKKDTYEF